MTAARISAFILFALGLAWCGRDGARLRGQTRPRPAQIRNIEQIRICSNCGDNRARTLVLAAQLKDGRTKVLAPVTPDANPIDIGRPTVCVLRFLRVAIVPPDWPAHNIPSTVCYTQAGLAQLLTDPAWLAWWNAQPPLVDPVAAGAAAVIQQLTQPRPPGN